MKKSNQAKGRNSFDATIDGTLVAFMNKNATPYPTEVGGPAFDLIPVKQQKDVMINVARLHAQQEYNRIMDLVKVLQAQANQIKRRLEITDMVHAAKYDFQIAHGQIYWLAWNTIKNYTILTMNGPKDWTVGKPEHYDYITRVKWLGDYTWQEINE